MMAVYVVVKFEDDLDAKIFTQLIRPVEGGEIVAAFKCPTLFCDNTHIGIKKRAFTKGLKWGWWLCDMCMRPTKMASEKAFEECHLGKNILESYLREKESIDS